MIDKNECNISEKAKEYLTEKYGSDWEIEASSYPRENNVCSYCVFHDEWKKGNSEVCKDGNYNKCLSCSRQDKKNVAYKLTDEFKKKLEMEDEILTPDFSLAEDGDKVQNLNGVTGKVIINSDGEIQIRYMSGSFNVYSHIITNNICKFDKLPPYFYGVSELRKEVCMRIHSMKLPVIVDPSALLYYPSYNSKTVKQNVRIDNSRILKYGDF